MQIDRKVVLQMAFEFVPPDGEREPPPSSSAACAAPSSSLASSVRVAGRLQAVPLFNSIPQILSKHIRKSFLTCLAWLLDLLALTESARFVVENLILEGRLLGCGGGGGEGGEDASAFVGSVPSSNSFWLSVNDEMLKCKSICGKEIQRSLTVFPVVCLSPDALPVVERHLLDFLRRFFSSVLLLFVLLRLLPASRRGGSSHASLGRE